MHVSFFIYSHHKNKKISAIQRQSIKKICRASMMHAKNKKNKRLNDSKKDACISLDAIYNSNDNKTWTEYNPLLCSGYMSVVNSIP